MTERLLFTRFLPRRSALFVAADLWPGDGDRTVCDGPFGLPLAYSILTFCGDRSFWGDFIYSRYRIFLIVVAIVAVGDCGFF